MNNGENQHEEGNPGKFPRIMIVMTPVQLAQAFSLNVMWSVKAIFIATVLGYDENSSVMINHIFISFEPIAHLTGAILADSCFGKWKVIVSGLILMRIPDIFFLLSTLPSMPNKIMYLTAVTLATLFNIHFATLGAFYSEQFRMPDQEQLLKRYYNIIYWCRNVVSVFGAFSGSRLANLSCLSQHNCYLAPYAVWVGTETIVAVIIVSAGTYFVKKPPTQSVILNFLSCIVRAITNKIRLGKDERRERWIDYADDVFNDSFRNDVNTMLNMLYFFIMGILYWSLYDQLFSRFIYQGAKLDGHITEKFRVYPGDTMMLNPISIIILLPLLEYVVYPVCRKMNMLKTELQKVCTSEYIVATAMVAAALLEWQITTNEILPPQDGYGHIVIFNTIEESISVFGKSFGSVEMKPLSSHIFKSVPVKYSKTINVHVTTSTGTMVYPITVLEKEGLSYILRPTGFERIRGKEKYSETPESYKDPSVRCVCVAQTCYNISFKISSEIQLLLLNCLPPSNAEQYSNIKEGEYEVYNKNIEIEKGVVIRNHMDYTFILLNDGSNPGRLFVSNPHFILPIYWIIPQISIMSLGEVMHAIPWRLFMYTQSPPSMRSIVFALDLVSRSLGDLLVAVIAATAILKNLYEFILFAVLMYITAILFTIMAVKYKVHKSRD